jgi:hypothetical protein
VSSRLEVRRRRSSKLFLRPSCDLGHAAGRVESMTSISVEPWTETCVRRVVSVACDNSCARIFSLARCWCQLCLVCWRDAARHASSAVVCRKEIAQHCSNHSRLVCFGWDSTTRSVEVQPEDLTSPGTFCCALYLHLCACASSVPKNLGSEFCLHPPSGDRLGVASLDSSHRKLHAPINSAGFS